MKALTIKEMSTLAKGKGGRCVSLFYGGTHTPLEWECANGHRWSALPSSVKQGHWCKRCAVERKTLRLDDLTALARERGGVNV